MSPEAQMQAFSQEEIDYLSSLHFINQIDSHLRIVSNVKILPDKGAPPPRVVLLLELMYDNDRVANMSFDLHGYEYEEIIEVARNVRDNEFIMYEVDTYLSAFGE